LLSSLVLIKIIIWLKYFVGPRFCCRISIWSSR